METYEHDIFYDIAKLPREKIVDLLHEAKELSYNLWVDKLDVSESFARQRTVMGFEEVMQRTGASTHFVFIHRKGYANWKHHLEIGFRTMEAIDHFLFLHVDESKKQHFLEKYELERL